MRALRPRWQSLLVGAATVGIVLLFLAGSGPRGPALPSGPTPPPVGTHAVAATVRSADAGPGRLGGAGPAPGAANRSAISSPTWGNATGAITGTPPRVTDGSLAYDPLDGYLVLFGGHDPVSGTDSSATLAFEGDQWVTLSPPTSPPARVDAALAWDPLDQYLVLFGGSGASVLSDTWTYSHDRWTELNLTNHPSGRDGAAMTWDGSDGYLLLFGGSTSAAGAFDDTWKFVGGNWTQLHPVFSPPARTSASFAFDPTENDTVLFGGDDGSGSVYNQTWAYSVDSWFQRHPTLAPPARTDAGMAWDPALGEIILYGGNAGGPSGRELVDTWAYGNASWTPLTFASGPPPPPAPVSASLAADPAENGLVEVRATPLSSTWLFFQLTATATVSNLSGDAPLTVNVSATAQAPLGPVTSLWDFGNGYESLDLSATAQYPSPGEYEASLTVGAANGTEVNISFPISVGSELSVTTLLSPTTGFAPLTVAVAALGTNGTPPYDYSWSSGIGTSSSDQSASFLYPDPGRFDLTLEVVDASGASIQRSFSIDVVSAQPAPLDVAVVVSTTQGSAPLTVVFADSPTGGAPPYVSYWSFGDGNGSFGPAVTHTYSSAGTFNASVTVTDSDQATASEPVVIDVTPPLTISAAVDPTVATAGSSITFRGSVTGGEPPYTVLWEFGDGVNSSDLSTTHAYEVGGTYHPSLVVLDSRGILRTEAWTIDVSAPATTSTPTSAGPSSSLFSLGGHDVTLLIIGGVAGAVLAVVVVTLFRRRGGRRRGPPSRGPRGPDGRGSGAAAPEGHARGPGGPPSAG